MPLDIKSRLAELAIVLVVEMATTNANADAVSGSSTSSGSAPASTQGIEELIAAEPPDSDIFAFDVTRDGTLAVTGHNEGLIKLWDLKARKLVTSARITTSLVSLVEFLPDNRHIALVHQGTSGTVRFYDVFSGQQIWTVRASNYILDMDVSLDGRFLATASTDGAIDVFDLSKRQIIRSFKQPVQANGVALSSLGEFVASAGDDSTIRIWNVKTNALIWKHRGHTAMVHSVAFSPTDKQLASGSNDRTIKIWDVGSRTLQETLFVSGIGEYVVFSENGAMIANGATGEIFELSSKKRAVLPHHDLSTNKIFIASTDRSVVFNTDRSIFRWKLDSAEFESPPPPGPRLRPPIPARDPSTPTVSIPR